MDEDRRTPQEIADAIIDEWVSQMRSDRTLVHALAYGKKVDVTLCAFRCKAVRAPSYTVQPSS